MQGNEIADKLARDSSVQKFVGPKPFLQVSRQNIRRKIKRWMDNQHLVIWCGPCSTQRQAQELISRPELAKRARLLSLNRTQSRVVVGLLTGHNTLRRHLYVMGMSNNPICRKCGTEEETSDHVLCAREAVASLRHSYLDSFFLDPEDVSKLNIGAIWKFAKGTGLL
jgi:Fe2+ transport system protein FeoA